MAQKVFPSFASQIMIRWKLPLDESCRALYNQRSIKHWNQIQTQSTVYMWPSGLMGSDFIWWFISIIIFNFISVQYISSVQLKFHQAAQWLRVQHPIPTQVLQLTNTIRLGRASEFLSLSKLYRPTHLLWSENSPINVRKPTRKLNVWPFYTSLYTASNKSAKTLNNCIFSYEKSEIRLWSCSTMWLWKFCLCVLIPPRWAVPRAKVRSWSTQWT